MSRIRATFLACDAERPMYIPTRARSSHLLILLFVCSSDLRTYAGHPNGAKCLGFVATSVLNHNCAGVRLSTWFILGVSFNAACAVLSACGHRWAEIAFGHRRCAWASDVRTISCKIRTRCSAYPFWWWAPTAQNDNPCCFL